MRKKKCSSVVIKEGVKQINFCMSLGKMDQNCIYWKPAEVIFSIKFHIIFQE